MAITKVTSGLISADASSIDLNIDAGTLYLDVSENKVGIGTTSPSKKFVVSEGGAHGFEISPYDGSQNATRLINYNRNTSAYFPLEIEASQIAFEIDGTEKMRIDSSGNVGIGTTSPTSYYSGADNLVVYQASGEAGITIATANNTTGAIYFADGTTSSETYQGGIAYSHGAEILNLVSGGSNKMTINSSGNVGIGTTSPSELLHLSSAEPVLRFTDSDDGNYHHIFSSSNDFYISADRNDSGSGNLILRNGGTSERMRIGSDGKVYFGNQDNAAASGYIDKQTSGNYEFKIHASTSTGTNRAITFHNRSNTEAMRIDTSGNLLVGTTSSSQTSGAGVKLIDDGTNGRVWVQGASQTSGEGFSLHANGSYRFYVAYSGAIASTSTSITAISDERLKENIVDLETGLTEVMSLKPRRFDWKENEGSNEKNVAGFIAQEVETVLPDLISDYKHEDLDDAKSVRMGDMIPTLVKAIQEQQTIIDDLKSRIETLEG